MNFDFDFDFIQILSMRNKSIACFADRLLKLLIGLHVWYKFVELFLCIILFYIWQCCLTSRSLRACTNYMYLIQNWSSLLYQNLNALFSQIF